MQASVGEVIRFGVVGIVATATHFAILFALVEKGILGPTVANGAAFLCAVGVTYFGQSLWVFSGHGRLNTIKLFRFSLSLATGLVANMAIMAFATEVIGLEYQLGFLMACFMVPALSFVMNKFWVFREIPTGR